MKLTITQIGFFALIIMTGVCIYLFKRNGDLARMNQDKDVTIKSMAQGIQEYKAKDGTWNQRLINERRNTEDIKNSKDSIIQKMNAQLKNANVKLQNALALGYVETTVEVDTVVKYVAAKPGTKIDTLLDFSKPPYIINTVKLTDTLATNKLSITNEQYIMTNAKREFVDTRKKFFLWRWFQKRHWVIYTDIHNTNPYLKTKNSKFITIVDDKGNTKNIEN